MKSKLLFSLLTGLLLWSFSLPKTAEAYYHYQTFTPSASDLYDLDHSSYYSWGINWTAETNEVITWAELSIKNINNWTYETNDQLYIHLLDQADLGVRTFTDNQLGGDNFNSWSSAQIHLDTYTDLYDAPGPTENYYYQLTQPELDVFNQYVKNGRFGFGFDADCHYYNDGVKFKIKTEKVVPEPASIFLLTSGLLGLAGFRRKER